MLAARRPLRSLVAAAVVLPVLALAAPAAAGSGAGGGDTVVGKLVQVWPERDGPAQAAASGASAPLSWVASGDGGGVRVNTADVAALPVGATVAVTVGAPVRDDATRAEGLAPARQVLAAQVLAPATAPATAPGTAPATAPGTAPASAPYTDRVTVVTVAVPGTSPDAMTADRLVDVVNGPVADYWRGESNGAIRISGSAGAPGWIATTAGCADPYALWTEVAGRVGFTRGAGRHLLLYVPGYPSQLPGCAYGLAELGGSRTSGGYLFVRGAQTSVLAHELGHNFGLGHSSAVQCDRAVETGSCRTWRYQDLYDVMGASWQRLGSLNVVQASRLGVLPAGQQRAVTARDAGGTVTLSPVSGRSGTRAVRLTGSDGAAYWLELRTAAGRDGYLATPANWPRLQNGVLLRRAGTASDTSLLLDGTPSGAAGWNGDLQTALPLGRAVPLARGEFTVTVLGVGAGSAQLRVATRATAAADPIGVAYRSRGGTTGLLGPATSARWCGLRGGGCFQVFQRGSIYWSPATGARMVSGPIRDRWAALGWEAGWVGYPVAEPACGLAGGRCAQNFQGATLVGGPTQAVRFVRGAIRDRWAAGGGGRGVLGYPVLDEWCGLRGGGCFQLFEGGAVYWSPATGARIVRGAVWRRWAALGWEAGGLGYPVGDTACGLPRGGCAQNFQGGSLYGRGGAPVSLVRGDIRSRWSAAGGPGGSLGYPVMDEWCGLRGGGCFQYFERGAVYWSPRTGAHAVTGRLLTAWERAGWERSRYGYPVGESRPVDGRRVQRFQGGTLRA